MPTPLSQLEDASEFHARHIGPDAVDESLMCAAVGTEVFALVRDKRTPMVVSSTPFTPNRYYRG